MNSSGTQSLVRIGLLGAGAVMDYHHVPAIALDPRCELVAVCDPNEELLEQRRHQWQVPIITTNSADVCGNDEVDAVIIATPNDTHAPLALDAMRAGKHVLCEKPLGVRSEQVKTMYAAAREAGVVHMTAFTYRFAPAMRYLRHLLESGELGEPRHFRSQRFLDLPETSWGWRQYRDRAGAGDLYDMTIHRIDFAMDLLGPLRSVCGGVARFAARDRTADGASCPPSEVDDWSAMIGEFECGATGVWEGTTLAKGYHRDGFGHEWAEVNGSQQSAVYRLHDPNHLLLGRTGGDLEPVPVPKSFLKPTDSPRDPSAGEPVTVFRYDIMWEFISAIVEKRDAIPSFGEGLRAQIVADAVLESHAQRRWIDVSPLQKI